TEWGLAIDASGELLGTDVDGPYDGVVELASRPAASDQVKDCIVRQWFRIVYGRVETGADACSLDTIQQAFAAADYHVEELIVALTMTDAFRYRRAERSKLGRHDPDQTRPAAESESGAAWARRRRDRAADDVRKARPLGARGRARAAQAPDHHVHAQRHDRPQLLAQGRRGRFYTVADPHP